MRRRIIDILRKKFPGAWTYSHHQHRWSCQSFSVQPFSALASRYDGDDDTFETQYYRSDTNERVCISTMNFTALKGS